MKLKTRLIVVNLGVLIVLSGLIVGYLMVNAYTNVKKERVENIQMQTDNISKEMEEILNEASKDVKALASTFINMKENNWTNREVIIKLLKKQMEQNDNYIYAWTIWEPNAFDNQDSSYINQPGSDNKGRFLPYWERSNNKLILDYDDDDIENLDYYSIAKQTKKSHITKPIKFDLEGEEITTIGFCEPIIIDNKFYGVVGLDISLKQLTQINSTVKLYDNGFGRILNEEGIVLAHPQEERVNKIGGEFEGEVGEKYLEKIVNGERFRNTSWATSLNKNVYKYYTPINLKHSNLKWSYTTIVPTKELMQDINNMIYIMIIVTGFGIIIIGTILYRNSKYVVDSIILLSDIIIRLSKYDLTFDENHKAVKFLKRKDETGTMANALATMQINFIDLLKQVQDVSSHVSASSEQLTATAEELSNSSEEVARTIDELARGAMNQAQDTEVGVQKINDLGDLINTNQVYMNDVNKSSNKVYTLIDEGLNVIEDLTNKTSANGKVADEVFNIISKTNESSEKIRKASGVIASIAEQTNLLALNAAIEAARAGEAGKGFSVVAEEIRKLAEQSTYSTKEIDFVVNELVMNSSGAVKKMEEVKEVVEKQILSVKETEEKYNEISGAVNSTEVSIERMSTSVEEMENRKSIILDIIQSLSAIAEENAAGTEEASASTEEQSVSIEEMANSSSNLAELAMELQKTITKFKI
jgi:methyl-accepting chemotaxis protein